MGVGGALRQLGRFLDRCEQRRQVDSVDLVGDASTGSGGLMAADITLTMSLCPTADEQLAALPDVATVDDDGRLRLAFESIDDVVPDRPPGVGLELADAEFDGEGGVSVTITASATVGDPERTERTPPEDVRSLDGTDGADAEPRVAVPGDQPGGSEDSTTVEGDGDRDADVPPFRDPELLREVYESHDTFAEMPEALGMDVTAETVRRYMIDHGIHEPNSYDTTDEEGPAVRENDGGPATGPKDDGDPATGPTEAGKPATDPEEAAKPATEQEPGDEPQPGSGPATEPPLEGVEAADSAKESPLDGVEAADTARERVASSGEPAVERAELESSDLVTDGIGLPEDVTLDGLVEAVRRANTIYEVETELDLAREEAREMLERLDLIDYVAGRLSTNEQREVSREQVVKRLRRHAEPP